MLKKSLNVSAIMLMLFLASCQTPSSNEANTAPTTEQPAANTTSETNTTPTNEGNAVAAKYDCPMKCEGAASDKPGKCPKCGMDLEEVK